MKGAEKFFNPVTLLFLIGMLVLFGEKPRARVAALFVRKPWRIWLVPAAIWIIYIAVGVSSGGLAIGSMLTVNSQSAEFFKLVAYFALPTTLLLLANKFPRLSVALDIAAVLCLWLPFDLRWITKNWFGGKAGGYQLMAASAMIYALIAFSSVRKFNIGARWKIYWYDLSLVLRVFAVLSPALIFCGLSLHFLKPGLIEYFYHQQYVIPLIFIGVFLGPALAEELLFRGLILNALSRRFTGWVALVITSVLFGLAHLDNKVVVGHGITKIIYVFPNWRYVFMATIAGFCYGYVYKKTGSLLAAALLHMSVDATWVLLLRG